MERNVNETGERNIHNAIDWNRSIVGGSYALHKFLRKPRTWEPNDMDILLTVRDWREFETVAKRFTMISNCIQTKQFNREVDTIRDVHEEDFDKSIIGTKTFECPSFNKSVQLVAFKSTVDSTRSIYEKTSDLPSCVSYQVEKDKIHFNVPEKGLQILQTIRGKLSDVNHKDRIKKYRDRGFTFE